jgi:predicted nuclease of predicted toxin-antitoxin system
MRFVVDFNVGRAVAGYLKQAGYDTSFVGDVDPRMSDADILLWAVREQRIVVTMDADFGEMVYRSGHPHSGVIFLRMSGARREAKVRVVKWILEHHADDLSGHFCVFDAGVLRIR